MRFTIDTTECVNKQQQIVKIFNTLMDKKLTLEAKLYSIIFAQMNKKKVVEDLTYSYFSQIFLEMGEVPPSPETFEKALAKLRKIKIKYIDEKGQHRSTYLIKEVNS